MTGSGNRTRAAWDQRYSTNEYAYGVYPNAFLSASIAKLDMRANGQRVLCLAEGEGRNAVYLATLGYDVTAMDQSRVGLEKAEQLATKRGVDLAIECGDLGNYQPESNGYHLVTMIWAHASASVRKNSYRIVDQALKAGGHLILEGYVPSQATRHTGGPSQPDYMFTLKELRANFPSYEFIIEQELTRDVQEGRFHTGLGDVVQVLARKS